VLLCLVVGEGEGNLALVPLGASITEGGYFLGRGEREKCAYTSRERGRGCKHGPHLGVWCLQLHRHRSPARQDRPQAPLQVLHGGDGAAFQGDDGLGTGLANPRQGHPAPMRPCWAPAIGPSAPLPALATGPPVPRPFHRTHVTIYIDHQ
jgi:hypothetical protein